MAAIRKPRSKVGVIGLGIIGSRVAAGLRAAGHQVYVWSRSPHSAPNFLGSVVEVADLCDVIQIFVSNDEALLEVVRTIAAALRPKHLLTAHATVSPDAARQAAAIVEGQGARYLDAPFTGSKAAAQNRQLVYYIGGRQEILEEARPVLEATSKQIVYLGGVGDASVLKIATNMLTAATVQTLAEALAVVRTAGIDGQRLVEAFEHNASQSATSTLKLPAMLARNFEANFSLKHMLKDVRLAAGIAAAADVPLPVTETIEAVFSAGVQDQEWGDEDFCVVTRNYDALLDSAPAEESVDGAALDSGADAKEDRAAEPGEIIATAPVEKEEQDKAPGSEGLEEPKAGADILPPPETKKAGLPPIAGDASSREPRRGTLRIIRDLFKPA